MALRTVGRVIRISTKTGLTGGTAYLYYEAGLWKGTDETIENYAVLKKKVQAEIDKNPDVKKWMEYSSSSISSSVKPYSQAVSDFRKEWLDFDLSVVGHPINGIIKPGWNRGVAWTVETVADLPENLPKWSVAGWQKIQDLAIITPVSEPAAVSKKE